MPRGLAPFENAKTYADLVAANIMFLEGKLMQSPYHFGPVDKETIPLLSDIIALNQAGFITVQSQPSDTELCFVDKTWYKYAQQLGNWWYSAEKKPFVEGYLPIDKLEKFIAFMRGESEYYYNIYIMIDKSNKCILRKLFPRHRVECKLAYSNLPQMRYYNLTRERCSVTKLGLNLVEWDDYTNLWTELGVSYDFEEYPNIAPILMGNSVKIIVMGKHYSKGSAIKLMVKFFNQTK